MINSNPLIIFGSSRSDGNTRRAIDLAFGKTAETINLADCAISSFCYDGSNRDDDFFGIVDAMLNRQNIVFATPVYWYAMSSQMKIFFDRLSDLLTIEKQKGRALAGKRVFLLATGSEKALPNGFEVPFARTSAYFNMKYGGFAYLYTGDDAKLRSASELEMNSVEQRLISTFSQRKD